MDKVDYTLSFINMHQNGELAESEIIEALESGLLDEEILNDYNNYLEEQEYIYNMYLNGEIDDQVISELFESNYFDNNYLDLMTEATLTNMISNKLKNAPIIRTSMRKKEAMEKRPGLYNKVVGNPAFKSSKFNKLNHVGGNTVANSNKITNHLKNHWKKYAGVAALAAYAHGHVLNNGRADLENYDNTVKTYKSAWFNKDAKLQAVKDAREKAIGNHYFNIFDGKTKSGKTINDIDKELASK